MRQAEHIKEEERIAAIVANVVATFPGKELFKYLEDRYVRVDCFNSDPLKMARNVANRDLVNRLIQLKEKGDQHG